MNVPSDTAFRSAAEVFAATTSATGIPKRALRDTSQRSPKVVQARRIAWLLLREMAYSYPTIAGLTGSDHSSVLVGVRRATAKLQHSTDFAGVYHAVKQKLHAEPSRAEMYMRTVSGGTVHVFAPNPDEIEIGDIAYHLAGLNRFWGATRPRYNVADHSVRVAQEVGVRTVQCRDRERALAMLAALLHDAAEAYMGDIIRPVKVTLLGFSQDEQALLDVILAKYGALLAYKAGSALIEQVDAALCATELRDLVGGDASDIAGTGEAPLTERIIPRDSEESAREFLRCFSALTEVSALTERAP